MRVPDVMTAYWYISTDVFDCLVLVYRLHIGAYHFSSYQVYFRNILKAKLIEFTKIYPEFANNFYTSRTFAIRK